VVQASYLQPEVLLQTMQMLPHSQPADPASPAAKKAMPAHESAQETVAPKLQCPSAKTVAAAR